MTREEIYTLIVLRLGPPKPIVQVVTGGKAAVSTERVAIDYACEFISIFAASGHPITSEGELMRTHKKFCDWYSVQVRE